MSKLKVTCTNACALKKLHVLGENHDSPLKAVKERVTQENVKLKQLEQEADSVTAVMMYVRMHVQQLKPPF